MGLHFPHLDSFGPLYVYNILGMYDIQSTLFPIPQGCLDEIAISDKITDIDFLTMTIASSVTLGAIKSIYIDK